MEKSKVFFTDFRTEMDVPITSKLQKLCRTTDAGIMLSVLEFVGAVHRVGKRGNAILWGSAPTE